mmetsp:Transcript_25574/g.57651  ORF Transcript_25574/g.57651 Transcript_25574/m.57651 type:complete len:162 (-) Transcript_25574:56-541(-)
MNASPRGSQLTMPESSLASMSCSLRGNGFDPPLALPAALPGPDEAAADGAAPAEEDLGVFAGVLAGTPVREPRDDDEDDAETASENGAERRPAPVRVVRRVRRERSSVPFPRLAAREGGGESGTGGEATPHPPFPRAASSFSGQLTVDPRLPDTAPGVAVW